MCFVCRRSFLASLGSYAGGFIQRLSSPEKMPGLQQPRGPRVPFKSPLISPRRFFPIFLAISHTNWCVHVHTGLVTLLEHILLYLSNEPQRFSHSRGRVPVNMVALRILLLPHAGQRRSSCRQTLTMTGGVSLSQPEMDPGGEKCMQRHSMLRN